MTTHSTSTLYAAIATIVITGMLFVAPMDSAKAGNKSGRTARDDRGNVGKLQCQGPSCADRHVRDQVVPRGENIAGPNPIVRDHRGRGTVRTNPDPYPHRKCRGWERNCQWPAGTRDHRSN